MKSKKKKRKKQIKETKLTNSQLCDMVIAKSGVRGIKMIRPGDVETAD